MLTEKKRDENCNWVAPLPFKQQRSSLPNNRQQALNRARYPRYLDVSLKKYQVKLKHVIDFMQALFDNGHADRAPGR